MQGADGTDVNSVSRSKSEKVLATSDDFGLVKLFSYPCVSPDAPSVDYRGHSSHVTTCRFTHDDKYLVTTGGDDKCVFQWKHEMDDEDDASEAEDEVDEEEAEGVGEADDQAEGEPSFGEARGGGDEFMAVKVNPREHARGPTPTPTRARERSANTLKGFPKRPAAQARQESVCFCGRSRRAQTSSRDSQ